MSRRRNRAGARWLVEDHQGATSTVHEGPPRFSGQVLQCGEDQVFQLRSREVLGTPLGHEDFVAAHLSSVLHAHQTLLERIPLVQDVQCAWALLLHSAAARANYQLRVVRPELTSAFAQGHDDGMWSCLCQILHIDPAAVHTRQLATLPLSLGGLGLRSAIRT